ncbi:capsular polysaccharide synthesis protein [Actinoplanes sp. NPDC049548]|uniref:capsular polysaccharide synthesis protein n=1 Tax=Actinoplanes sp. NPDC049548 TaxID=3155152 RepID=UPI00341CEAEF
MAGPVTPVVNLVPNPGFRGPIDQPVEKGGTYVHVHAVCEPTAIPGLPGVTGVRVSGRNDNNDTHIAPGGRNASGQFRLGMRPGATYTASVGVFLDAPLTGALNPAALRLVPGCVVDGAITWSLARSAPARNEYGHHRISATFTVPAAAEAVWIRLISGMSQGNGAVYWYSLMLTETDYPVRYFDGSTDADDFHTYEWLGEPHASPSRRTLRVRDGVAPAAIADEAVRLAEAGATVEARALLDRLEGSQSSAARVRIALGEETPARKALRKLVKAGDSDGEAAYQLGRLALRQRSWVAAERLLKDSVAKRPEAYERGYALAFAYDKLGRRADSKRASAAALMHDIELPFDGPAVLDLDVKSFGARRELGIFVAEHLEQIRRQAEARLAARVGTTFDQPIFIYWGQGFEFAPPVVRACLAALKANNPGSRVHELTDDNLSSYVEVPEDLSAALNGNRTHFSDLLRLLLLEKFGGIWVDGTCYVTEPLRPHVDAALARSTLFAFNYTGPYISSWFLASRPGSYAVHLWRAACFLWWEKRAELIDYFLLHHVFEMLYHLDDRFRAEWDEGQRLNSRPPHALQNAMLQPYDPEAFRVMTAGSFVHKLRYKYQAHELRSESYLARIIRDDLAEK